MTTTLDIGRRDAVIEQLFLGAIGALETLHIYVGTGWISTLRWRRSPTRPPASWPPAWASPSGTRASGSNSRPSLACSTWFVMMATRRPGVTGCQQRLPRS
jgi:hypothetical protein